MVAGLLYEEQAFTFKWTTLIQVVVSSWRLAVRWMKIWNANEPASSSGWEWRPVGRSGSESGWVICYRVKEAEEFVAVVLEEDNSERQRTIIMIMIEEIMGVYETCSTFYTVLIKRWKINSELWNYYLLFGKYNISSTPSPQNHSVTLRLLAWLLLISSARCVVLGDSPTIEVIFEIEFRRNEKRVSHRVIARNWPISELNLLSEHEPI